MSVLAIMSRADVGGECAGILKTKAFTGHRRSAVGSMPSTWPTGVGNRHVRLVDAVIRTIDAHHRINHIKRSFKTGCLYKYILGVVVSNHRI